MPEKVKQTLLMAPPTNFVIRPPNEKGEHVNEFAKAGYEEYRKDSVAFHTKAHAQWNKLKELLANLGAEIVEIVSDNTDDDMVFTADPSLSIKNSSGGLITIFSRFSNARRQNEAMVHANYFEKHCSGSALLNSHFATEGTGDNVYDPFRDVFWSGYTKNPTPGHPAQGRSDKRAHIALSSATSVEVISLNVVSPFFHIDTSFAPLTNGHILCYPGGISDADFAMMKKKAFAEFGLDADEYLILVSKEDAQRFACNVRCVGDTVVIPECSQELRDRIKSKNYQVMTVDLSCFIAAGGAVHCLTNNINEQRIPGGYEAMKDQYPGPKPEN